MENKEEDHKTETGYKRSLTNAHIQLIALGGTIGTGLFLGVGDSIHRAGPSVILIYIIVGFFLFLLTRALGQMLLSDLSKHTYIDFIEEYLGKDIGSITGYLYWLSCLTLAMAEVTALGIYFKYWFPSLKPWIPGTITIIVLLIINLISARFFGNLEFAFAIIKIAMIIGFVVLILFLMLAGKHTNYGPITFANLKTEGGFFAGGTKGFLQAFQMVIFSFIGVELIGMTAAEAQKPKQTLRKAINQIPIRLFLFYVLAIVAILIAIPWRKVAVNSSPFVQALTATGIRDAGNIINFVVISAAVSSTNSFIYSAGRLLFSITYDSKGKWNQTFGHLSRRQVPQNAMLLSSLIMILAPIITLIIGNEAFNFIASTCTSMYLVIWSLMIASHLVFRHHTSEQQLSSLKLNTYLWVDYLLLAFFFAVIILLVYLSATRISMLTGIVIFLLVYCLIRFFRHTQQQA